MGSLFENLEWVLNESELARRLTDVSDEMMQKLCDPQTPFREWDKFSYDFLKENEKYNQFYPIFGCSVTRPSPEERGPLWDCDEVCDEFRLGSQPL